MLPIDPCSLLLTVLGGLFLLRIALSFKSLLYCFCRWWSWLDERAHVYQSFEIPRRAESGLENPLYPAAAAYVASLPSLELADTAEVFSSGRVPNDFSLISAAHHPAADSFLGCRVSWSTAKDCLVLRLRRQDRVRVLRPYLCHVESVAAGLKLRRRQVKLYCNAGGSGEPSWRVAERFAHPATLDAVALDPEVKARVLADLDAFLKGRAYYHGIGRAWRRSYLLHGPPGTGKSSFAAAMANFLGYDLYDLDLACVAGRGDLKALFLATRPCSVILVEHLDRYENDEWRLAGLSSFMDGVLSFCCEERVMVFTTSDGGGERGMDKSHSAVLRPGRFDVRVNFPLCDFRAFKALASSHLGLKDHKLYPKVEEEFQTGAPRISPAAVGEIMMANRASPSQALKMVITALQRQRPPFPAARQQQQQLYRRSVDGGSDDAAACGDVSPKDFPRSSELKNLYGLIKKRSRKNHGVTPVDEVDEAASAERFNRSTNCFQFFGGDR